MMCNKKQDIIVTGKKKVDSREGEVKEKKSGFAQLSIRDETFAAP